MVLCLPAREDEESALKSLLWSLLNLYCPLRKKMNLPSGNPVKLLLNRRTESYAGAAKLWTDNCYFNFT